MKSPGVFYCILKYSWILEKKRRKERKGEERKRKRKKKGKGKRKLILLIFCNFGMVLEIQINLVFVKVASKTHPKKMQKNSFGGPF